MGQLYEQPTSYAANAGRGTQGISEGLSLNNTLPVAKPPLPTGPKPAPAPVDAAAPIAAEPSLDKMSDVDLNFAISIGKASSDPATIRRGVAAASIAEGRADQLLGAEQDKKTLEEKTKKAEIDKQFAESQKDLTQKQQKILDSEHGSFAPTKETAKDIAGIFSLMTLATFGSGTVGKYHGMTALASLTGAMKGYKEGRDDLYKKEMDNYNKSLAEYTKHQESLLKQVELSQKLLSTDKEAAMSAAQAAIAMDTGGIASFKLRQGNYKEAIKILEYNLKTAEQAKKDADSLEEKKREADQRDRRAGQNISIRLDNQSMKGELVTGPDGKMYRVVGNKLEEIEGSVPGMAKLGAPGKGATAADRYGFGDIVAGASNEAAAAIKNLMGLPFESTSGWFGTGKVSTSLFTAPLDVFANKMTPESVQRYNVQSGKLGYNLAQLMSGGRAVRVSDVDQMNKILSIREGDTMETAATRLAEARQLAERTMEVRLKSPNTPPGLKDVFKENLETIQAVVPFTVDDVNKFVNSRDENITFSDALAKKYNNGSAAPKGTGTAADPIKLE